MSSRRELRDPGAPPLRRSPRKRFNEDSSRRGDRSRSYRYRTPPRSRGRKEPENKEENCLIEKTNHEAEKTYLDKKLEEYSIKTDPDVKEKTDIFSDKFDAMAFIYSDVDPPHFDGQARAADCVEMLLAKWDREDGLVIDENVGKKKRGWKKEERKIAIKNRDVTKLREMSNEAIKAKQKQKFENQNRQETEEYSSDTDEVDLDKLAWSMTGKNLPKQRWEELGFGSDVDGDDDLFVGLCGFCCERDVGRNVRMNRPQVVSSHHEILMHFEYSILFITHQYRLLSYKY
ncbi:Oidioi.mRNA.OKI2018_I69.chr1.g306.t1.cds [Oikopleura dioica]|uniref:Oidioi.mRNA.OKI2018_I69.chr1.g306.t1.cds n=1 Tax=Oikopleura dioica TaxID=34765 RepID=A0ABN7SPM8_OIKDI|nr:Oidioi.mRNA.OKI2018_I69.chr1.g306.t1.cds [Oikopleura dioica]